MKKLYNFEIKDCNKILNSYNNTNTYKELVLLFAALNDWPIGKRTFTEYVLEWQIFVEDVNLNLVSINKKIKTTNVLLFSWELESLASLQKFMM
jgi:hypothetical protein